MPSNDPSNSRRKRPRDSGLGDPSSPNHEADPFVEDSQASSDEEGEDLYNEGYMKDYLLPDEESSEARESHADEEDDNDWIANDDSSVSEISDSERVAIDALIDRKNEIQLQLEKEKRQLDEGIFSDLSSEGDLSSLRSEGKSEDSHQKDSHGESNLDDDPDAEFSRDPNQRIYVRGEFESIGFDWKHPQCDLGEWLSQEFTRSVVKNRIYNFFLNYSENKSNVYDERIDKMIQDNAQSFQLSYLHLSRVYDSILALWLVDAPDAMIELLEDAANFFCFKKYPRYREVFPTIFVRISDIPLCDPIRDFRQVHMNVLVRVEGVVIRRSLVYPQMQAVKYDCTKCGYIIGPIYQRGNKEQKVSLCPSCHSKGPFRVNMSLTVYRNHQTILLQESPGKVPPGRLPRSLEVVLTNDLIDRAKPGEEVDVTGIYRNNFDPLLNSRQGFAVFTTVLQANNVIRRTTELGTFTLPDDERDRIIQLSKSPHIKKKLLTSMAPSIHGRDDIKLGLLLAMLGGVPKDVGGDQSHRIRGDINVLLVGDPGCAKSQFLKFVEKAADRTVFTTGRGSTAVGLTASVHKDSVTGDFVLEGGALVIADRGCCLIDEFDKMSDQDRTSIHEAMEQQTISVARGGIVTTLSARCSIIAAANPLGGRYDPSTSFDSNVNLSTPILSRFDLLFVVRDEVNIEQDKKLATFICNSHIQNHPRTQEEFRIKEQKRGEMMAQLKHAAETAETVDQQREAEQKLIDFCASEGDQNSQEDDDPLTSKPLNQTLFKKYILFAKSHCSPRISNIDENVIARLYTKLRQESKQGGISITVRHMESIIRLSEAHARLHLREFVKDEDVTAAISLFLRCFIQTQKYSFRSSMESKFREYLDSETEPIPLIHHHIKLAVQAIRNFEIQVTGVEPTTVRVDIAELAHCTSAISEETLRAYFESQEFLQEYKLILHPNTGFPYQIEHTKKI